MKIGTAYFEKGSQRHIKADLKDIARTFDWVILPVTEDDLKYRKQGFFETVEAAHDCGLQVWVGGWGVGGVFGGEGVSAVGHLCPRSCAVQTVLKNWAETVLAAKPDVLFLDEPRNSCCRDVNFLTNLVEMSDIPVAVCMQPCDDYGDFIETVGSGVSIVGTDPYPFPHHPCRKPFVHEHTGKIKDFAELTNTTAQVWCQAFSVPAGKEKCAAAIIEDVHNAGIEIIGVWGYRGGDAMSCFRSARPEILWREIVTTIHRLKSETRTK